MANFLIIRALLEQKKLPLRELAKTIGMTEQGLQALIKKGSTNTATLEAIANALEVPISVFFGDTTGNNTTSGTQSIAGHGNTISGNLNITLPEKGFQKIIKSDGSQTIVEVASSYTEENSRELADENAALRTEVSLLKDKVIELQGRLLSEK